jgi:hypothetical protein
MACLRITRLLRFGLRSLFLAVAILCVMLGMKVNHVKQQQKAIAWIYNWHGEVHFDYEITFRDGVPKFRQYPPGPRWLHSLIGEDYFRTPQSVVVRGATDLSPLAHLTELRELSVNSDELKDLSPLAKLTHLRFLSVVCDRLSDVSPLASLTELENLYVLSRQGIDLSPLAKLTNLKVLVLRADKSTDLSPLTRLTSLEEMAFDQPLGSDEELARLKEALPNCTVSRAPIELQ